MLSPLSATCVRKRLRVVGGLRVRRGKSILKGRCGLQKDSPGRENVMVQRASEQPVVVVT